MSQRVKRLVFQILLLLVSLIAIELVLRASGYQPGDMKPNWFNFHPVDSLIVDTNFFANEEGILVANKNNYQASTGYINIDGFRTKDFSKIDTAKKKILLIGDSFTWGFSAMPVNGNCFADLLRNETGYEVINLGIPGADPVQYNLLARKYIPLIKPDLVILMFFMGNDLMMYDRPAGPGMSPDYFTNAGVIYADIDGIHFENAEAAYHYVTAEKYYLYKPQGAAEWIISKSALLSRLYSLRFRVEEKIRYERGVKDTHITKKYLKEIKEMADKHRVPVRFVLIPEIKEADMDLADYSKKYEDILADHTLKNYWVIPKNSKSNFNDYPDAHLNNRGHRYYADYLKSFLTDYFRHL